MTRSRLAAPMLGLLVVLVAACAPPPPAPSTAPGAAEPAPRSAPKSLTIGIWSTLPGFGLVTNTSPVGGGYRVAEMHSDGLITADANVRRPIGRLAEQVPTVDNGGVSVLPDGRMRVAFTLRKGVTWHDGTPFTAQDLVFSWQMLGPDGVPHPFTNSVRRMSSVEAPDDYTFVVYYRGPYYLGASLGTPEYFPLPRHILQPAYERFAVSKNADDIILHPYWTSEWVHLGAYRLTRWDPGEGASFEAYDRYFLGRPKIDNIRIRIFGDENTLVTNLLAGTADLVPEFAARAEAGAQLKKQWDQSGEGVLHVKGSQLLNLPTQFRAGVQTEPANLDPRVRRALLHGLDRAALSDAVNGGNPQLAAWSYLIESDSNYPAVRDGLRQFDYSVTKAHGLLAEAGWTPGPDGMMHHSSDGRVFRTHIQSPETGVAAIAASWRALGLQVDELLIGPAQAGDREFRNTFPGYDWTGADVMEQVSQPAAVAENRWIGSRSGYENPASRRLVETFQMSISDRDQEQAMRAFHDFFVAELPAIPVFHFAIYVGARKNVKAFDDLNGGGSWDPYGSHYRNAYLWDIQ